MMSWKQLAPNSTVLASADLSPPLQGSLMLLFEGPFGRILHTGDFRWEADYAAVMLRDRVLTWAPLDKLYIDNTYAHPRHGIEQLC